ncbi:hypothetical protein T12_6712 [Trichinella patagoniensis]|uniref:Uncharacterized protein n=1 Tax=Trichinella patagoniensis TaxID=990121 RepID=A0A0V0ZU53_9BILA|nr:hypothetical protein T12_6712 [Trichinella patagoniensis]
MYIRRQTERHQLVVVLCDDVFIAVITNLCKNTSCSITDSYKRMLFDYCSVHVSTVISHVSQQFRFLVFFIVTQWVVSVQWNYFYKLEYLSLMVVQVSLNGLKRCTKISRSYSCVSLGWLNGVTQYWSRNLCGFAYHHAL